MESSLYRKATLCFNNFSDSLELIDSDFFLKVKAGCSFETLSIYKSSGVKNSKTNIDIILYCLSV
jgi:hypothetical protein